MLGYRGEMHVDVEYIYMCVCVFFCPKQFKLQTYAASTIIRLKKTFTAALKQS